MASLGLKRVAVAGLAGFWLLASCSDDMDPGGGTSGTAGHGGSSSGKGNSAGSAGTSGNGSAHGGSGNGGNAGTANAGSNMGGGGADFGGAGSENGGAASGSGGVGAGGASGGEAGDNAGGNGGAGGSGPLARCTDQEYEEVGVAGCRKCTNWKYGATPAAHVVGPGVTVDLAATEVRFEALETFPLPKSWSSPEVFLLDPETGEPAACAGQLHYSVRAGELVADFAEYKACAQTAGVDMLLDIVGFAVNYGCAGEATSNELIEFSLNEGNDYRYFDASAPLGPVKELTGVPARDFVGTNDAVCEGDEYAETGYPGCRACGDWYYDNFDLSCRVVGTNHHYDAVAGEVIIEPGPELPLPIGWGLGSFGPTLSHENPDVTIPPCSAALHTSMRNGLMIVDVSEFQDCVAGLPPGASLFFGGDLHVDYGCAGDAAGAVTFDFKLTGGDGSVYAGCDGQQAWPPKHYP